jgi:hypothetical protein
MLLGNFALALSAIFIALNAGASLCLADAVFWAAAASMVGIRYLDIARFRGQTVMSEPATMAHWRRYVVVLPAVSLGVWGLAHGVAYLSR